MQRRDFMTLLSGAAATWPLAVRAQQPGRIYKVGYQSIASREQTLHFVKAFEDGLRSLGYRVVREQGSKRLSWSLFFGFGGV
jgi:putative ABC transport system substrate-binding protein